MPKISCVKDLCFLRSSSKVTPHTTTTLFWKCVLDCFWRLYIVDAGVFRNPATATTADSGLLRSAPRYLVSQCIRCLSVFPPSLNPREYHLCWLLINPQRSPANHLGITILRKGHGWLEGRKGRWPFKLSTGPLCINGRGPLASQTLTGLNRQPSWGLIPTRLMSFVNTTSLRKTSTQSCSFGICNATNHPTMTILTLKCTQAHSRTLFKERHSSQLGTLMSWGKQRLWECLLVP